MNLYKAAQIWFSSAFPRAKASACACSSVVYVPNGTQTQEERKFWSSCVALGISISLKLFISSPKLFQIEGPEKCKLNVNFLELHSKRNHNKKCQSKCQLKNRGINHLLSLNNFKQLWQITSKLVTKPTLRLFRSRTKAYENRQK